MKNLIIAAVITASFLSISCSKEWKNPNETMPATKVSISTLLAAPTVYDGAGVNVKGMVWDIVHDDLVFSSEGYIETLSFVVFKISNKDGNYVNVYTEKINEIKEGDLVEVVGIYRRNFISELRTYTNEIEARNIKVVKSLKKKYSDSES